MAFREDSGRASGRGVNLCDSRDILPDAPTTSSRLDGDVTILPEAERPPERAGGSDGKGEARESRQAEPPGKRSRRPTLQDSSLAGSPIDRKGHHLRMTITEGRRRVK
jgi:hypothetical protein